MRIAAFADAAVAMTRAGTTEGTDRSADLPVGVVERWARSDIG